MAKTKAEITIEFNRKLLKVNNAFRQYVQFKLKEHDVDLTFEMLQVMGCLWNKDGTNQQEIANVTVKDKASITYLVDNLTKRGLVTRLEDANDRRNKLVLLTEKGKALKTSILPVIYQMHEASGMNIAVDRLMEFMAVLDQIEDNLRIN